MKRPIIQIAEQIGKCLSSRYVARQLREEIEESEGGELNFENVYSVSDSFADELFAVLVESHGPDWFAENVKVSGLTSQVREVVLRTIALRCATLCGSE
jgi:hypothetical protein